MPKSNSVSEAESGGGGVYEEECFSSPLPVGKKGAQDMLASLENTERGRMVVEVVVVLVVVLVVVVVVVVWCVFFLLPPSSNSTLPCCPRLRPFRELGGGRGVCVCVCMCVCKVSGGLLLKPSGVEPLALSPLLHPTSPSLPHPLVSLLLSPGTKNALNAWRLLQCQITKG
ncbi:Hypothetical predicted protein [Xyrichtys novacula]|uniref:Uncharacterized protein n=1 Tax=Xyrichtys novacula TaxID=13765 RepID=A0AAV1FCN6_XYRNO|nr:Hypothetical predicted protein [Xyrichtys novacula]